MAYDIVPVELVVKAMQDSGYKNAAYAIAELIDNSIQANATAVEMLCLEREELVNHRQRSRLSRLAVLDNGHGMDPGELRRALQFGNGGHLNDRKGIGRFGMGLPNSSMSQGSRVEVWTWQNGVTNAIYSYIDLDEILAMTMREVPEPTRKGIPAVWKKIGKSFGKTGTLVVWGNPNRCTWRTATAIVRNSEEIIGRIYRRFINDGRVTIRLASYNESHLDGGKIDRFALPNDPLYLMKDTSCPEPYDKEAMFEPWGEPQRIQYTKGAKSYEIVITFSHAKAPARVGHNPGGLPHGKHAARNLGVSIVRADRELELDSKWMPSYDPIARWIGVEVDFPPELDEEFGVTNNKQSASHLADLAGIDKNDLAEKHGCDTYQQLRQAWDDDGDVRLVLLEVKTAIESGVNSLTGLLKAQTRGARAGQRRHEDNSPEKRATQATAERKNQGFHGSSDDDEGLDRQEKRVAIKKGFEDEGVQESEAEALAKIAVERDLKYSFGHADSNSSAFFNVKPKGGALLITLNTRHPAYDNLVGLLEDSVEDDSEADVKQRLNRALDGMKLILSAWARYEDEQPDGDRRIQAQDTREDWGRVARQFLRGN